LTPSAVVPAASLSFLVALVATSSACSGSGSSGASASSGGGVGDAGGDGAVALDPTGDPPTCPTQPGASQNPPANNSVAGVLDVTATKLVVFGGDTAVPACGPPPSHQFIGDTYAMDVGCATWTKGGAGGGGGPSPRGRQAMALDPATNHAVLFGGRYSTGGSTYTNYADVWTYDFAGDAWTQVQTSGKAPSGRSSSAAIVDAAGNRLVVFGGNTSTDGLSFVPENDTWALDLATGAWTAIAAGGTLPPAREFHAMAVDPVGRKAYVYAGGDANAFQGPFLQDVWALDLASDTWSEVKTTGTGPGGRIQGAIVFDATTHQLLAFAGHDDGTIGNENDLYALDVTASPAAWSKLPPGDTPGSPATGTCTFPPDFTNVDKSAPERRSSFAYAPRTDGHGFVVFAGGSDCGLLADTWWWSNGTRAWTNVQPSPVGQSCLRVQTTCKGLCG
jgi:N-acetylneuraminic acid mutarotase